MLTLIFIKREHQGRNFNGYRKFNTNQTQVIAKYIVRVFANNAFIQPLMYKRKNIVVRPEVEVLIFMVRINIYTYSLDPTKRAVIFELQKRSLLVMPISTIAKLMLNTFCTGSERTFTKTNISTVDDFKSWYSTASVKKGELLK